MSLKRARPSSPSSTPTAPPSNALSDASIYHVTKRLPVRPPPAGPALFISRATPFRALLARIVAHLDRSPAPIALHAMGAAIVTACTLAVVVREKGNNCVKLEIETRTVAVYDDYMPMVEGLQDVTKKRLKSAVCVKVQRLKDYV